MRATLTIAIGGLLATPTLATHAAEVAVNVEIPQLRVAEYHRPYVAVYVEGADQKHAANLAVWYMSKDTAEGHGTKWLPDLRQWWRKSGRTLDVPVDGVTGPTRPAGRHALRFDDTHPELAKLPPGSYTLVVEAAREVGGRELLKIPFTWPVRAPQTGGAQGSSELGAISLSLRP
ncbi:MAG: DUF2271 domain-containing protein [Luteimonas sp.]|nr:DUF2271 domain-containing protein [Luteimonas sp.]